MPDSNQSPEMEKISALISQGESFTFENFSTKSRHGFVQAFTPEWVAWTTRCRSIITRLFGQHSAQHRSIEVGLNVQLIGNDHAGFDQCVSYVLGTLNSSLEVLENDLFEELQEIKEQRKGPLGNKIFVVHGHDDSAKTALEVFLTEIGLEPIVLHRQPDEGKTLIEKFEKHSDVGYAFILLTPDEIAYLEKDESKPDDQRNKEKRARPNVIFEFGFFVGKLGRARVCCLHTGDVKLPSDLDGLVYKKYVSSIEEVAYPIIKDLKAAGYTLTG